MDDRPPPLPYARPDVNRPPPEDREVRIGGALQSLMSVPCIASQIQDWATSSGPTAAPPTDRLAFTVSYFIFAIVVVIGSSGRNGGRRRWLYGIYMIGTAALLATVAACVLLMPPANPREPLLFYVLGLLILVALHPAFLWIGSRWIIFGLFPMAQPKQATASSPADPIED